MLCKKNIGYVLANNQVSCLCLQEHYPRGSDFQTNIMT